MKKTILLLFTVYAALSLLSFSGGFGRPATMAPGESGASCGQTGCHAAGAFNPELALTLTDADGELVTEYVAGDEYTVSLKINHTGLPVGYGFQIVCLDGAGSPINNFSNFPASVNDFMSDNRQYVEQFSRLPVDSIPLTWTSPIDAEGGVVFYAVGNAVNGAAGPAGDGVATSSFAIAEKIVSSTNDLSDTRLQVFPNPTQDVINVPTTINVATFTLHDLSGKTINTTTDNQMNISDLETGSYIVKVMDKAGQTYSELIQKI